MNIIFFNHNLLITSIDRDIQKTRKKKESLRLSPSEIVYVSNIYDILHIFLKPSIHLQASDYSIIKYVYSHVFNVRKKLKIKYEDSNLVSFFFFSLSYFYFYYYY